MGFDAVAYWNDRLGENPDLKGVGFKRKSIAFNEWVYLRRVKVWCDLMPCIENGKALDVGSGTGYFSRLLCDLFDYTTIGIDINKSVRMFGTNFLCADITNPNLVLTGPFDVINVMDVLYHIVDDQKFKQAITNIAELSKRGTRVILTDMLADKTVTVTDHVKNRSINEYQREFSKHDFIQTTKKPLFFTLMPPLASGVGWLGVLAWEALTFAARWEWAGNIIGRILYKVDTWLGKRCKRGPSTHIAVFRKT